MRTRCPACGTIFRVTSGQLRLKAGKVRCGQCQQVFNAFDHLLSETAAETALPEGELQASTTEHELHVEIVPSPVADAVAEHSSLDADATIVARAIEDALDTVVPMPSLEEVQPPVAAESATTAVHEEKPANFDETLLATPPQEIEEITLPPAEPFEEDVEEAVEETPEVSTQAAREAGLVAVRELNDPAAYNRWAAGALASDGTGGFVEESAKRPTWLYVLFALLLVLGLAAQLLYHYRTQVVLRMPAMAALYEMVDIEIPLPREADLVVIESSDLQYDNGRNLFVLQATLRNRARYAQAWPTLELTLTDTNDNVVARRVMYAAHYLPPGTAQDFFPANGEVAVRLWIDAKDLGAVGYRLYIFYP